MYYHVTNDNILEALKDLSYQLKEQRRIFNSVLSELGCEQGYLTNSGMLGIHVKNRDDLDDRMWCMLDSKKYGPNALRPAKSAPSAKHVRSLFFSVPKIDFKPFIASLKVPFPVIDETTSHVLSHPGFTKAGGRFLLRLPEWTQGLVKFPEGVTEVTHHQYQEWKSEEEEENQ